MEGAGGQAREGLVAKGADFDLDVPASAAQQVVRIALLTQDHRLAAEGGDLARHRSQGGGGRGIQEAQQAIVARRPSQSEPAPQCDEPESDDGHEGAAHDRGLRTRWHLPSQSEHTPFTSAILRASTCLGPVRMRIWRNVMLDLISTRSGAVGWLALGVVVGIVLVITGILKAIF